MTDDTEDLANTVHQLSELVERRRTAAARRLLSTALPKHPESVELLANAAWVGWLDDDNDEARSYVEQVLRLDPEHYSARYLQVSLDHDEGKHADAERAVIDLLGDYPEHPALYALYARIMLQTFNIDKAEQLANEALKRDPDNLDAMTVRAQCAFIREPGDEQRARLERVLREHPDQTQSTVLLVQRLIDLGKNDQAYELSRTLVVSQPDNPYLVEMADALRHASHWSMKPLWPMQKWGWGGSIAIWFGAVLLLRSDFLPEYQGYIAVALIVYVVYSWVWPPILKRLLGVK